MDKKIGKAGWLVAALCVFSFLGAEPSVTMRLTDPNGDKLQQAQVNIPFVIHISVSDDKDHLPTPQIAGLEQFQVQGSQSGTSTIIQNGYKTVTKTYEITVVSDQEGQYTVGPVTITVDGKAIETKQTSLTVGQELKTDNQQEQQVFAVISFDQEKVYVGQEVLFTLRFYYANNGIRLSQIKEPAFKDFNLSKLEGPTTGMRTMDQQSYRYLEWTAKLFPEQIGTLQIDPIEAVYTAPRGRSHRGSFGLFDDFFGGGNNVKRLFSNTATLTVEPLPEHTPPVKAVGNFSSVQARLNNPTASEGEATVLTLDLVGRGNIESLNHPPLTLPSGLTFYESSSHLKKEGQDFKKSFEYIVQGLSPDEYTIESQVVTFFNPHTGEYKDLKTEPLKLAITGAIPTAKPVQAETPKDRKEPVAPRLTILEVGPWKAVRLRALSLFIFLLLFCIPLLVWLGLFLKKRRADYFIRNAPEVRYQNAFKNARQAFDRARKGNYDGQLYHIFIELFGARLKLPTTEVSETLIENTLTKAGLAATELVKWRLLFAHMAEQAFSSYGTTKRNDGLFNQAAHWLSELEKLL